MSKPTGRAHPPLLRVEHLTRRFGDRSIGPIDLAVGPGERVALTGPNGSGKSTLIRCLAGTLRISDGSAWIADHVAGSRAARSVTGVALSADRSFALTLTGRQNLEVVAQIRGLPRRDAVAEADRLCRELEIEVIAATRVDRCSTGMVAQLGLARALLGEPRLLLLDEPTRSLDEAATDRLWGALAYRKGTAVLIASHDNNDTRRCDRELTLNA